MLFDYPWIKLIALVVSVVVVCLLSLRKNERSYSTTGKMLGIVLLDIAGMLIISVLAFHAVSALLDSASGPIREEDILSDRISVVSSDLARASKELSNIQEELETRIEFVQNLKKEAEIAENVISLSDEQVKAVQSKLNQELEASSGKNITTNVVISAIFFALGFIVNYIVDYIKAKKSDKCRIYYKSDEVLAILEKATEDIKKSAKR